MRHYLFIDQDSGEEFLVGAYDTDEAYDIAIENFGSMAELLDELTEIEAECSGLDEY